jgi:threonine aldolase
VNDADEAVLDLRSDFVSRPTPAMVAAMTEAAGRRGGFGLREDRDVSALEALAARMTGKEDALFCASCGLANQVAIHLHCRPGAVVVAEADSHVITSEAGGPAALSGVMFRGIAGREGIPDPTAVDEALRGSDPQRAPVELLVLENTHVRSGGSVMDLPTSRTLHGLARDRGIPVHLDGSRVFNAAAALGVAPAELCAASDSVAFSLNKGLSAPLGAILAGSAAFIERAVRVRQMFGGGWRPAGIPAAAATVALATMPQRLARDHEVARALAGALTDLEGIRPGQSRVQTNLVLLDVDARLGDAARFAGALAAHGVLALPFGTQRLRLAVYHEIEPRHVARVREAFRATIDALGHDPTT